MSELELTRGASAWNSTSLREEEWRFAASPDFAAAIARQGERLRTGAVKLESATPAEFDGEHALASTMAMLEERVRSGPGFAVLSGLPTEGVDDETVSAIYWGLGTRLGNPRAQNAEGKRIHRVEEKKAEPGTSGGSTSPQRIVLHTENALPPRPPAYLSLLCLRQSRVGGDSLLASGHAIHNQLAQSAPAAARALYEELPFGRQPRAFGDGKDHDRDRVFSWDDGRLRVRYSRYWIDRGFEATGEAPGSLLAEAISLVDQGLEDPEFFVSFKLRPGDLLLVDNTVVLHGREAFDSGSERCLLRMWVD
jgi:hypothetical protein